MSNVSSWQTLISVAGKAQHLATPFLEKTKTILARFILQDSLEILMRAAGEGDLKEVNRLLQNNRILAEVTFDNNAILRWAARNGQMVVVMRLLEIEAVLDLIMMDPYPLLLDASFGGLLPIVNGALGDKAVLAKVTDGANHAFDNALYNNNLPVINRLLEIESVLAQVIRDASDVLMKVGKSGSLPLLNRFLRIEPLMLQLEGPYPLGSFLSLEDHFQPLVDRMLEVKSIRRLASVGRYSLQHPVLVQGLKRALWLSLQSEPGFTQITSLNVIPTIAAEYLQQHPDWLHAEYSEFEKNNLATGLSEQALSFAAESGCLKMVEGLLKIKTITAQITAHKNQALRRAITARHLPIVNRFLEMALVRQNEIESTSNPQILLQGLKRALWLSLQKEPGFTNITNLSELESFAAHFLQKHSDWLHPSYEIESAALVKGLSNQILAFRSYAPFSVIQSYASKEVFQKSPLDLLHPDLHRIVESFVGSGNQGLSHFNEVEFKQTRVLALHLYQSRYTEVPVQKVEDLSVPLSSARARA